MEEQEHSPRLLFLTITMVVIIIIIGVCAFVGYQLGTNNVKDTQTKLQPINGISLVPSQSSLQTSGSSNGSANWTIYTDVNFSIKYPTNWLIKKGFTTKEDVVIYDPHTVKAVAQNGSQSRLPTNFVDILSVTASTQSAMQLVDNYKTQASVSAVRSEESSTLGENQVLVHMGSDQYNTVLWSQNGLVAQFTTSIQHLNETTTENKILQSFQFIKQ